MPDMNAETAKEARDAYESMQAVLSTPFGTKLKETMKKIKKNAADKALQGQTPENTNVFFESRGKYAAMKELSNLITDTEKANADAIKWQQANPPQENASEKTE